MATKKTAPKKTTPKKPAKPAKKAAKTKAAAPEKKAKKAKKGEKAETAGKKGGKELTPIQKAQLARAAGKKGKSKSKKKARPVFKAPADMKPIFVKVDMSIGKDGHLTQTRVASIKGKLGSDTAKVLSLGNYDLATQNAIIARVAGPMFIKSEKKRLAPGLQLSALFRVGKSKKTGGVAVRLKETKAKMPEKKPKVLDKKDPIYRTVRKAARPLEAAFTKLQPFPSGKALKELLAAQD